MGPNTFLFMLRWQLVPFIVGVAAVVMSTYGLLTFQGDGPDAAYSSLVGLVGRPIAWGALALGLSSLAYAWYQAARLRNGG